MQSSRSVALLLVASVLCSSSATSVRGAATLSAAAVKDDPAGPGLVEETMELACTECKKYEAHLGSDCMCHATDVMGTFENDATKTLTTREEYGFKTEQTGADRLKPGWRWHCRPVTGTEGVWKQC
mmetsp:Transcript_53458/g.127496  ORF Transcript_53458/g.127496 Transcript_53458/m.127496 type:complete len:126 (+) Transcript_53458:100-477(+)